MKMSFTWLKDHLDTSASLEDIASRLTMSGLVVDSIHYPGKDLADFHVVEIQEALPHPNANRLQVCKVNTGAEILQIVCGAPNARAGMKAVLAPMGSKIPATGLELKPVQIRGIDSQGMLCSAKELNLDSEGEGIIEVPQDAVIGQNYAAYLGMDDAVLDIEITPNRGDCLGAYGLARDLAATGMGQLKPLQILPVASQGSSALQVKISPEALKLCPFFAGRMICGVQNRPSPAWLQQRLSAIGLRPISALVDITNYLAYDLGRPMHVFDADKISGHLCVRLSQAAETLEALDDKRYALDKGMVVVADQAGPLGVAGIMGGFSSGCSDVTSNVFIESALFDAVSIALTGRKLNILTDSRYRFERGVDAALILPALEFATRFIVEHCGGVPSEIVTAGTMPCAPMAAINFHPHKIKSLAGLDITELQIETILKGLGFVIEKAEKEWRVRVPSWRHDVTLEADLVEEVARIYGYDEILPLQLALPEKSSEFEEGTGQSLWQKRAWISRRCLASRGLNEVLTWSFVTHENAELFGGGNASLQLVNPISADLSDMRPSLLSNLIDACKRNHHRGFADTALFEVGFQFHDITPHGEKLVAAGMRTGSVGQRHWAQSQRLTDIFDAKADCLALLAAFGMETESLQIIPQAPNWYHPGRSGAITLGPKGVLGYFGEIHPQILAQMDARELSVGFEIFLDAIPNLRSKNKPFKVSPYQPIERDFAFVVDQAVAAGQIISTIRKADPQLIREVSIFDVYQGKGIEEGKKSVALKVRFEPQDATLTEVEITALFNAIVAQVKQTTGGELRS